MQPTHRLLALERIVNLDRVAKLHRLLQANAAKELEDYVAPQLESGLLSDELLNIARGLQRLGVVLFLSTLGHENLAAPNDRQLWMTIYSILSKKHPIDQLENIERELPIWWVTKAIAAPFSLTQEDLKSGFASCNCNLNDLGAAFELAFDWTRHDVIVALIESLQTSALPAEAWLHFANLLITRFTQYSDAWIYNNKISDLAHGFALIRNALPENEAVDPVKSMLSAKAARIYMHCGQYENAIEQSAYCTDPLDQEEAAVVRRLAREKMEVIENL